MQNVNRHIDLLGKEVKDRITGFKGTVTSISFDLYGCVQAVISPGTKKDGTLPDGRWFDVTRLEVSNKPRRMEIPNFAKGYIAEGYKGGFDKPIP